MARPATSRRWRNTPLFGEIEQLDRWRIGMELPRRTFLHLAAGAAALPALSRAAWAENYPARPVRVMIGYPAGYGRTTRPKRRIAK